MGLTGQDLELHTYHLRADDADRDAVANKAYGSCHMRCLTHSPWGMLWGRRIAENLRDVRRLKSVGERDHVQGLRTSRTGETVLIGEDGWLMTVSDRALKGSVRKADGRLLPVTHELNLDLTGAPGVVQALARSFASGESFPLLELVEGLGVAHRLLYPEAIRGGRVSSFERLSAARKPIEDSKGATWLHAELSYHQFLPEALADFVFRSLGISEGEGGP